MPRRAKAIGRIGGQQDRKVMAKSNHTSSASTTNNPSSAFNIRQSSLNLWLSTSVISGKADISANICDNAASTRAPVALKYFVLFKTLYERYDYSDTMHCSKRVEHTFHVLATLRMRPITLVTAVSHSSNRSWSPVSTNPSASAKPSATLCLCLS